MIKIWLPLCLIVICLIFFRIPKEVSGLTTLFNSNDSFGSSSKLEAFVNILLGILIFVLFIIVISLNINKTIF